MFTITKTPSYANILDKHSETQTDSQPSTDTRKQYKQWAKHHQNERQHHQKKNEQQTKIMNKPNPK
jgi:DNA repair ATPase RecN